MNPSLFSWRGIETAAYTTSTISTANTCDPVEVLYMAPIQSLRQASAKPARW